MNVDGQLPVLLLIEMAAIHFAGQDDIRRAQEETASFLGNPTVPMGELLGFLIASRSSQGKR